MLMVNSAKFYKNITYKPDRQVSFSGEYKSLPFKEFPSPPQDMTLAIDFHAENLINGLLLIRVRQNDLVVHETALQSINIQGAGAGKDVGFISNIKSVVFPNPGQYLFDIIFNQTLLYSAPLRIIKLRQRH